MSLQIHIIFSQKITNNIIDRLSIFYQDIISWSHVFNNDLKKSYKIILRIKNEKIWLIYDILSQINFDKYNIVSIKKEWELYSLKNKYIYHVSNPLYRDQILKDWLICKPKWDQWLSDTELYWKYIFLTDSDKKEDLFDSWYDDDLYKIDTSFLTDHTFMKDPNFDNFSNGKQFYHIVTIDNIPIEAIQLIYKWNWNNKD